MPALSRLLSPGLSNFYFIDLEENPTYWHRIVHMDNMDSAFIDELGIQNYPLPSPRMPLEPATYATFSESFPVRWVPMMWSMADAIAKEDIRDDPYNLMHVLLPRKGGQYARMFNVLTEIDMAGMFINYGFTSLPVPFGPDGVSLFNLNHPYSLTNNATWANRPSVDVDMSVATYNFAYTNLRTQRGPNGIEKIYNMPDVLTVHPNNRTIAHQLTKGDWQPDRTDRNMNVIRRDKVEVVEWPYFELSGAQGALSNPPAFNGWMVTGKKHYVKFFWRETLNIETDTDVITRSELMVGHIAYAKGWGDARGMVASPGS